ncbi:MAG: NADH-quinone oxidoreductase subunit B family protein [Campylobacteraceae bacterium]
MSTYVVPNDITEKNSLEAKLKHLKNIKRSIFLYRVDCGSCNGCEIEIFATITPMWDVERFGIKLAATPRHADILICTGPVTRQMYYPLIRAYEATPDPKVVVAFGACGATGGIFHDCYSVVGGVDKVLPVDVFIPGCPPHPAGIVYGLAIAIGILEQKLHKEEYPLITNEPPLIIENSILGNILFERDILAESKKLMGYFHGRKLYDKYINALKSSKNPFNAIKSTEVIENAIKNEEDMRYAECMQILHEKVYLPKINSLNFQKKNLELSSDTNI